MTNELLIDPWTWLDHKPSFSKRSGGPHMAPMWVGEHFRRLQAYKIFESYYKNSARHWMDTSMSLSQRDDRREYGDPQTVVNQIVTSILGSDQSIVVGEDEKAQGSDGARSQRTELMLWAEKEKFFLKLLEAERMSCRLGDAVYVLGWDSDLERPRVTVWDPGFYFPVLDPRKITDAYPDKVHIAYDYEEEDSRGGKRRYVRRITWELADGDEPILYSWNDIPSYTRCLMSDATWLIDDLKKEVEEFTYDKAMFATYVNPESGQEEEFFEIDIGLDFIPIVHIPNTPAGSEHYGQSSLAPVIQILDDLVSTDTDLQASSATTGTPPIAISGATAPKNEDGEITSYGPGTVLETGDGTATMIDTSRSLDALLKYDDHLLERLSVNGRVPESLLGRVKPSEVPSGIALSLSFAPHASMIQEMRMVRKYKYALLFKFISRLLPDVEDIHEIHLVFGSFLPADRKETVDLVVQLLSTRAISLETAVKMLVEAGFDIEDAGTEVERITTRDYNSAEALLGATGDVSEVRKILGLPEILEQEVLLTPPDELQEEEDFL